MNRVGSIDSYRFGFNGQEKDNEAYGEGNAYDFGARIYDPRLGRWLSLDPLMTKYPDLSPYSYSGNSPILFTDFDGQDFGVKIDNVKKTIVIVANVYTVSNKTTNQAKAAANMWNTKTAVIDGYTVSFEINVIQVSKRTNDEIIKLFKTVDFYKPNGKLNIKLINEHRTKRAEIDAREKAEQDPIGNSYSGNESRYTKEVTNVEHYDAGYTYGDKHIWMNDLVTYQGQYLDQGENTAVVAHEFGHFLGLDDDDGVYYSKGGIMDYGSNLTIQDADVATLIKYILDTIPKDNNPNNSDDDKANVKVDVTGSGEGK